jgi:hypothetical protein
VGEGKQVKVSAVGQSKKEKLLNLSIQLKDVSREENIDKVGCEGVEVAQEHWQRGGRRGGEELRDALEQPQILRGQAAGGGEWAV